MRELPAAAVRWVLSVYALGLLAVVLGTVALPRSGAIVPALVLAGCAALGAVTEARAGRVQVAGQTRKDLGSVWVLCAALIGTPLTVGVVAAAAYLGLAGAEPTRRNPARVMFNWATYGVAGTLAHAAFQVVADGSPAAATPLVLAGLAIAAAVMTLVSTGVVAEMQHRLDRRPRRALLSEAGWSTETALCCVALLVAVAADVHLALVVLALPPVLLLHRGLLHRQMLNAARTDAKTGLLNHASWLVLAERVLTRGGDTSVLLLDLDHFKHVNDEHGHLVGDQVLVAVAEALAGALRPGDLLGRFGGEEFAVLLPQADRGTAASAGERLRLAVAACEVATPRGPLRVTASIGAVSARDVPAAHGLLEAADAALYEAKRSGRDRLVHAPDVAARLPVSSADRRPAAGGLEALLGGRSRPS